MNDLTLTLSGAGAPGRRFSVPTPSRYWRIKSAPSGAVLSLRFDDDSRTQVIAGQWGYRFQPLAAYQHIQIESSVAGDVTLTWAENEIIYDAPGVVGSGSALNVSMFTNRLAGGYNDIPAGGTADPGVGSVDLSKTRRVIFTLAEGSPGGVIIMGSGGLATQGAWLYPERELIVQGAQQATATTGTFTCYNPQPVAVRVHSLVEYFS